MDDIFVKHDQKIEELQNLIYERDSRISKLEHKIVRINMDRARTERTTEREKDELREKINKLNEVIANMTMLQLQRR